MQEDSNKPHGETTHLRNIAKTTFLFGSTQAFNVLIRIVQNKVVAVFLGASGIGLISMYNNIIHLTQIGCGLGVNQSAIRFVAIHGDDDNKDSLQRVIHAVKRLSWLLALGASMLTLLLSPLLSWVIFGDINHFLVCFLLGIIIGINIISDNQIAILKGTRQLHDLARIYCYGSITGLAVSFPCYYWLETNGIIVSLIFAALGIYVFSHRAMKNIYRETRLSKEEFKELIKPIVTAGIMLMLSSFVLSLSGFIIISLIRIISDGNLSEIGYYSVGITIIYGYFGMIMNSMTNDYYPRIAQCVNDTGRIMQEANRQVLVQIMIIFPCLVTLIVYMPLFIRCLYTEDLLPGMPFIRTALFGSFLGVCASPLDLVFVAKNQNTTYLIVNIVSRSILIVLCLIGYLQVGLIGIGIAMFLHGIIHYIGVNLFLFCKQNIRYQSENHLYVVVVIACMAIAYATTFIPQLILRISVGTCFVAACWFAAWFLASKKININLIQLVLRKKEKK